MSTRTKHTNESSLYYITFTCFDWLPLFQQTNSYDIVYKWFNYPRGKKNIQVTAYVIMPDHLHCILFFPDIDFSLSTVVSNAKRFMAYEIIKRLQNLNEGILLQQLQSAVTGKEKSKGQLHKVFEESFDAKSIDNTIFLLQKINYIHLNPVKGNYALVTDWRHYEHSSAAFYELQQYKYFQPVHYMELK
jgi:putative transposase